MYTFFEIRKIKYRDWVTKLRDLIDVTDGIEEKKKESGKLKNR